MLDEIEINKLGTKSKRKINIAVIDDNQDFLQLTKVFLTKLNENIKLLTFQSGKEFLEVFSKIQDILDVIVSDYDLPQFNGLELLEAIRQASTIPFIIFTGKGREEIAIKALNLGANFYLQKSSNSEIMYTELNHFINQAHQKISIEKALKESEHRYKTLVDLSVESIIIHINEKIVFANPSFLKLIGATSEKEVMNHYFKEFISHYSLDSIRANIKTVLKGNESPRMVVKAHKLDGTTLTAIGQGKPIIYDNKNAVIVYIQDLSDKIKLDESQLLLSKLPIGMILSDKDGNIIETNDFYLRLLNITKEELLKSNAADVYYDSNERKIFIQLMEKSGQVFDYKGAIKCRSADGKTWEKKMVIFSSIRLNLQGKEFFLTAIHEEK